MLKFVVLFLLIHGVLGDDDECIRYTFGEDFNDLFVYDGSFCNSAYNLKWNHQTYANSTVTAPNDKSKWFISSSLPPTGWSCIESFPFRIRSGGTVEANVYIDEEAVIDVPFFVYVNRIVNDTNSEIVGVDEISFDDDITGWRTMKVIIPSLDESVPFQGQVIFFGASSNAGIIVDSFRYIPPSMDPEECILYEDEPAEDSDDKFTIVKKTISFSISEFTVSKNKKKIE